MSIFWQRLLPTQPDAWHWWITKRVGPWMLLGLFGEWTNSPTLKSLGFALFSITSLFFGGLIMFSSDSRFQRRVWHPCVIYDPEKNQIRRVVTSWWSNLWIWDAAFHGPTIILETGAHRLEASGKAEFVELLRQYRGRFHVVQASIEVMTDLSAEQAVAFYHATNLAEWKPTVQSWLNSQFQVFLDHCDKLDDLRDPQIEQARFTAIVKEEFGPALTERWGGFLQIGKVTFTR